MVDDLKGQLDLSPEHDVFHITERMTGRHDDEITIQSRSLLSIMSYLARGIEVPKDDLANGRVVPFPPEALAEILERVPMRIRFFKDAAKRPACRCQIPQ